MATSEGSTDNLVAVLDIGSSAVRIVIADIKSDGSWTVEDSAVRPIALGRDVFTRGRIQREALLQTLQTLEVFQEMMDGWQIRPENVHAIATSAVREAQNRDTFLDRVSLRTGLKITVIDGIEANRLTYQAVEHVLQRAHFNFKLANSLVMEVGGGSTEVMLLSRGQMVAAHTLRLGTVRMQQQIVSALGSADALSRFIRDNVHTTCEALNEELKLDRIRYFIGLGSDMRLAAREVGRDCAGDYWMIKKKDYVDFVAELQRLPVDKMVRRFQISYEDADTLVPSLLVYEQFLQATKAPELAIPNVSIRDGVLLSLADDQLDADDDHFYMQVVASALGFGRKFHLDEAHGKTVSHLALRLFDDLQAEHFLDRHHRLLLEVAALLHDIGTIINPSSHHKHGEYLISNSEIFGLNAEDTRIVSNVVRYHRRSLPAATHMNFMALTRADRVTVMKLAAILRVADAMDRGHVDRITDFRLERTDEELLIYSRHSSDLSLERYGMATKGAMFEEVFGLRVVLLEEPGI